MYFYLANHIGEIIVAQIRWDLNPLIKRSIIDLLRITFQGTPGMYNTELKQEGEREGCMRGKRVSGFMLKG